MKSIESIYEYVKDKAKEKNIETFEVYMINSKKEDIKVMKQSLDSFVLSDSFGCSIRLIKDGKEGFSFTEKLDDDSINATFENAYYSLKYSKSEPSYNLLLENDLSLEEENNYSIVDSLLKNTLVEDIKKTVFYIEDRLYSLDKRIINVPSSLSSRYSFVKSIMNSKGINKKEEKMGIAYYSEAIAKENDIVKTGYNYFYSNNNVFSVDIFCDKIKDEVLSKLNSKTIVSGNYKTVLSSEALGEIFSAYLSLFFSESVQKKLSLFEDKKGKKIANNNIFIYDNPLLENGIGNTYFDGEGAKTKSLTVVENGILNNFLYNNYTARKDNTTTTSHASRASYKSSLGVSFHNFIFKEGHYSKDEIIKNVFDGVYITNLMGIHAGVNILSGDFSLQAEGIKIESGLLTYRISPFIVSGNFLKLLHSIEMIGNDTNKNIGFVYTPSTYVGAMSIACE